VTHYNIHYLFWFPNQVGDPVQLPATVISSTAQKLG
jgi:hypothetical protein